MLIDRRAGSGGWMDGWMDGWMGIKPGLRNCLAQSKNGYLSKSFAKIHLGDLSHFK
jgi:hypothetical protein